MPNLWLFDIEPHEQRYTSEWKTYLPVQLRRAMNSRKSKGWRLRTINGGKTSGLVTPGAFMNFAETNIYKSVQVQKFAKHVMSGNVQDGDRLFFADAWHPGIIQCRYMADLIPLNITIDVLWHAGSYDQNDLLGRNRNTQYWAKAFERSVFNASTHSYFATEYHRSMFLKIIRPKRTKSAHVVGWPMEYLKTVLSRHITTPKKDVILFPHRNSPEKQPHLIAELAKHLPSYAIVEAQKKPLSKSDYRDLVGCASAVISFSKQETLGIGVYEGMLCGALPIVPNRLSYSEMYPGYCYPEIWSQDLSHLKQHAKKLAKHIDDLIKNHNPVEFKDWTKSVGTQYFNGSALYASVLR